MAHRFRDFYGSSKPRDVGGISGRPHPAIAVLVLPMTETFKF
jgi:hypothetical protein